MGFLSTNPSLLVFSLLIGPLAGLFSIAYVRLVEWSKARGSALRGWGTIGVGVVVFALLGVTATAFPQILGNGKDVVQLAVVDQVGLGLATALLILKLFSTTGCLSTGAPGGLFTPTLTLGALLGTALGGAWSLVWPGTPAASFAVVGAAAVLAGSSLGPLSSALLVIELTYGSDGLLVPMMLSIAGATLISRVLHGTSMYSACVTDVPRHVPDDVAQTVAQRGDLLAKPCDALAASTPYLDALHAAEQAGGCVYVTDENGILEGCIDKGPLQELGVPPEVAVAGDAVRPCPALDTSMSADQLFARLADGRAMPLVDVRNRHLLALVQRRAT
jgi:CIC family chloride channel protein